MAGAHDHPAGRHPAGRHPSGRVPFWIHQLVELLLGILLLVQGARTGEHTAVLVTLGGLLLLLALCSEGALAAWPWISRRVHHVLDFVAAAVLAIVPFFLGLDHVLPIVILEVAAAAMVWLALRTEWRPPKKSRPEKSRPERSKTARPKRAEPAPAEAPPQPAVPQPGPPKAPPARPSAPAVPVARKVGGAVGKARDDGPRQLGRLVGKAQRAARAAMAPDTATPPEPSPTPAEAPGGPPDEASGEPQDPGRA
jgi:uncharacterized membrane protein YhaH (DUF805 family)